MMPKTMRVVVAAVSVSMRSRARRAGPEPAARAGFSAMSTRLEACPGALADWLKYPSPRVNISLALISFLLPKIALKIE